MIYTVFLTQQYDFGLNKATEIWNFKYSSFKQTKNILQWISHISHVA